MTWPRVYVHVLVIAVWSGRPSWRRSRCALCWLCRWPVLACSLLSRGALSRRVYQVSRERSHARPQHSPPEVVPGETELYMLESRRIIQRWRAPSGLPRWRIRSCLGRLCDTRGPNCVGDGYALGLPPGWGLTEIQSVEVLPPHSCLGEPSASPVT